MRTDSCAIRSCSCVRRAQPDGEIQSVAPLLPRAGHPGLPRAPLPVLRCPRGRKVRGLQTRGRGRGLAPLLRHRQVNVSSSTEFSTRKKKKSYWEHEEADSAFAVVERSYICETQAFSLSVGEKRSGEIISLRALWALFKRQ